jgi:V8-like Glu-specific endopeptidase
MRSSSGWLVGWLVGWLTTSATMATGCAGHDEAPIPPAPGDSLAQRQQEVRNGIVDTNNSFPFVSWWNTASGGSCSAVLITPTWILTAGHCITGDSTFSDPLNQTAIQNNINSNYTFFFGVESGIGFSA